MKASNLGAKEEITLGSDIENTLGSGDEITLGVLGGGQLGRMFCHAAQQMGFFTAVLDLDEHSPAGRISHHHIKAAYEDQQALARLAGLCIAVTTEFENVPAACLSTLAKLLPVSPPASAVAVAQDRILEKAHFERCGQKVAPYAVIANAKDVELVDESLFPAILKTARLGYDGKGQQRLQNKAELLSAWLATTSVPCVLETMLSLEAEISVIVARSQNGNCVNLPVQKNTHRDGILFSTEVFEGAISSGVAEQAIASAKAIAAELNYVGVLCVEFFVSHGHSLIVNEMAPRPHNSGHYSMNACDVSQFELQVRTLTSLPLIQPRQHSSAIMLNLLGDTWISHDDNPPWSRLLEMSGVHLHLYGKNEAKVGRKMGHINITADSAKNVQVRAKDVCEALGLEPLSHWCSH